MISNKASLIVMSQLSDAQELLNLNGNRNEINRYINFAKFIILQTGGNLNKNIDADKTFNDFETYASFKHS